MPYYRKKPVTLDTVMVEAVQLCWSNWSAVCDLLGDVLGPGDEQTKGRESDTYSETCGEGDGPYIALTLPTHAGTCEVQHGDYIIKDEQGALSACKPDVFRETYERVLGALV